MFLLFICIIFTYLFLDHCWIKLNTLFLPCLLTWLISVLWGAHFSIWLTYTLFQTPSQCFLERPNPLVSLWCVKVMLCWDDIEGLITFDVKFHSHWFGRSVLVYWLYCGNWSFPFLQMETTSLVTRWCMILWCPRNWLRWVSWVCFVCSTESTTLIPEVFSLSARKPLGPG